MEIIKKPLNEIKPYPKNAKKHSIEQLRRIADSIKAFGFNQPLVVDKQGVIIVGHGRYAAAQLLEMSGVPVIEVDLPEEKAKAYRLADNKLNESDRDMPLVVEELKDLQLGNFDITLTGFDTDVMKESIEEVTEDNQPTGGSKKITCPDCGFSWTKL